MDRRTWLAGAAGSVASASLARTTAVAADSAAGTAAHGSGPEPWATRGVVQRPGGVMGYAIAGQGPTLVLLPKLGGWIADWSPLARELAGEYRLIAIDPPGHGSSRMASEPPVVQTLSESAAMVRATLDELGVESFTLVGNSLGGCISVTLAALWPRAVERLVLISTATPSRDPLARILEDEKKADPPIYDAAGNPLPRSAQTAMTTFGMSATLIDDMNRSRAAAGRWIRASERGVRREGVAELLPRIEAPTLLVYSDAGTYLRHRLTAERLIPKAQLATIAGAGAFVHQERPAETARAIRGFLRA
jgi:pimeloyl-ACP methyl ester carboxylesterase